jgi:cytochrome c biogenesis protein
VIVAEGKTFANTVSAYDEIFPGPLVDPASLEPFALTLDDFDARFEAQGPQRGSPRDFRAEVRVTAADGSIEQRRITVNAPLQVGTTKVFLTGNGYAPQVTVRDGSGQVVLSGPVVFLPRDGNLTSEGVVKAPDAEPTQLGFEGLFLPTATIDDQRGPYSAFPDTIDPQLLLTAWTGDLGLSTGEPQSVFRLDTSRMQQVRVGDDPLSVALRPGDTLTLPDGQGSITFDGVARFANFQIASDPGRGVSLLAAVLLLVGLTTSLLVRRRRIWLRAAPLEEDRVSVHLAAQALSRRAVDAQELDILLDHLTDVEHTTSGPTTWFRKRGPGAGTGQ